MLTISKEHATDKQIDRACAAQSPDMLPNTPPSPEEYLAKRKAMEASINAKFAGI